MFGALKHGFRSLATLKLVVNVVGELYANKELLRHRAVSLRQHGFLVSVHFGAAQSLTAEYCVTSSCFTLFYMYFVIFLCVSPLNYFYAASCLPTYDIL